MRCTRESGPRNIRFSKDGRFAYILFELSNEIRVYTYDGSGKDPQFEEIQVISTLSENGAQDAVHDAASGFAMTADGKYIFCSTAGENAVSMFKIDEESGMLEKRFVLPISGDYPKDLAIFPDGRHIAVANHASNSITMFTVDYEKDILVMHGRPLKVETPNCISIIQVPEE